MFAEQALYGLSFSSAFLSCIIPLKTLEYVIVEQERKR